MTQRLNIFETLTIANGGEAAITDDDIEDVSMSRIFGNHGLLLNLTDGGAQMGDDDMLKYAIRRTQNGFHSNKTVSDPAKIQQLIQEADDNLKMMQRQVVIGHLYGEGKLVIESLSPEDRSDSR